MIKNLGRAIPLLIGLFLFIGAICFSSLMESSPSDDYVPPRPSDDLDSVYNRSVYVLGISSLSGIINESLHTRTEKVFFTEDPSLLINISNETMVMIDGLWLKNVPQYEISMAIRPVILNGSPVVVIGESSRVITDAVSGQGISILLPPSSVIYGIRYYQSIDCSGTLGIGGSIENTDSLSSAIALAYDWANRVDTLPARCTG